MVWNRLATRDRLRGWGVDVQPNCLLCVGNDECRQHLFFDCVYSSEIWHYFCSRLHLTPPTLFEDCLRWLKDSTSDTNILLIVKFIFQAVIYMVWKERNSRLHTSLCRPPQAIIQDIKQTLRLRLDPLSRDMRTTNSLSLTFLGSWLSFF